MLGIRQGIGLNFQTVFFKYLVLTDFDLDLKLKLHH